VPDLELGSDWIVGFPGERDVDHEASERFLAAQGFAVNYVFKYDPRPSTTAAETLEDDVPEETKKERNQRLLARSAETSLLRHAAHVGAVRSVFVEGRRDDGLLAGRSEHGVMVSFEGGDELVGTCAKVAIGQASAFGLSGARC
jgi:tRNA-2-methylthio-N6-dimethylallyladenosine synthase